MFKLIVKGKIFGEWRIIRDTLEYHTVRRKEHFMRKFHGFGISWSVLTLLQALATKYKCEKVNIFIHYKGVREDKVFFAPAYKFFKSEFSYLDDTHIQGDYQKFLPIEEFLVVKK
jgi:hypothetical protein